MMMKKIKFRGVHPKSKRLMNVCVIDWMHDEVHFEQGTDVGYPIGDCKLQQYTGLKDKNGVEIYEGDILAGWKFNPKGFHVVKFSASKYSCGFLAESIEGKGSIEVWYEGLEVIGNIHQNPELLDK